MIRFRNLKFTQASFLGPTSEPKQAQVKYAGRQAYLTSNWFEIWRGWTLLAIKAWKVYKRAYEQPRLLERGFWHSKNEREEKKSKF
jgi:hypothetical protein